MPSKSVGVVAHLSSGHPPGTALARGVEAEASAGDPFLRRRPRVQRLLRRIILALFSPDTLLVQTHPIP